ncbi:MAG: asparagine synthase (glutamine-hydrolyzing), partial [Woeseiaceae bacterium]|nr:asparagine synthase (glutamine-hydrolyzing) [Woeseiaceae bacterium]
MCGITGYWDKRGADARIAESMAMRLQHRGPDDAGVWLDETGNLALAHRRLAVIDCSPAGHQPMISPCGRFTLVFNGEIYNHRELRTELEAEGGHFDWRGHSDTETLLAALRHLGVEACLRKLNGMFAFALWDQSQRRLVLARDRMGEKPLYYGRNGDVFFFGSELKSFTAHPLWIGDIDRDALALYMRHSYVPAPHSIYQGIKKLSPAHFIVVGDSGKIEVAEPRCYWNLKTIAENAVVNDQASPGVLVDELDTLLRDSVAMRMVADVPLGALLSGGIDSTLVTAAMQAQSREKIKTFTIGFGEKDYNEAEHAQAVAQYLGTEHTELYVTPGEAMAAIERLPNIWDEPFSDSSQIPTLLISQLARKNVTVSLSGDGGDELFYGYKRYVAGLAFWQKLRRVPASLRPALGRLLECAPGTSLERLMQRLPERFSVPHLADRLPKLAEVAKAKSPEAYYQGLMSQWPDPQALVPGSVEPLTLFNNRDFAKGSAGMSEYMMLLDSLTYLPDDILTKVDRASMSTSLEMRVPLLDHRIVEYSWTVPMSMKSRDGQGKWLLRELLGR